MDHLSIRDEIGELLKSQECHDYLTEVNKNGWKPIIQKIEETFIKKQYYKDNLHWGWLRLNKPQHLIRPVDSSEKYINHFVDDDRVWFIVEDYKDKMWLYEGTTNFIIKKVIPELVHLREYYLVSKKFEWLLCVSHHDIVYGTGIEVVNKMKQYEQENLDQ